MPRAPGTPQHLQTAANLSKDDVRQAQLELRNMGLYKGSLDGVVGPESKRGLEQFQKNNGLDRTARLDGQTMVSLLGNIGINQGSSRCSLDISDRGLAVRYDRLSCQKRGGNTWRCRSGPRSILEKRCGTFDAYSDCHIGSRSGGLGCAQRIPAGARRRCTKNDTSRRPQCAVVTGLYTARTANSRVQRKGGVPVWSSTCNRVPNAITAGRWIEMMARDQGTAMARPSTGHTEGIGHQPGIPPITGGDSEDGVGKGRDPPLVREPAVR
jgi:peptidoglycan hydrolase-like protein with peptidoglycan-binding domain